MDLTYTDTEALIAAYERMIRAQSDIVEEAGKLLGKTTDAEGQKVLNRIIASTHLLETTGKPLFDNLATLSNNVAGH